ncbi:ribosome biogenesis protein [Grosmannia clavigera kw1407]|uniref:Ribosome biogenesis protein ERB1 n=1 Tax=Grosmannia clavigera (strain kw1407 / UAMH 11150) TaxID=655863 RepID=F0XRI1_GROCL|nr:ribosome biogenesis protein [Grosmannia clavigera kw1407]EFW99886.1 ribosome biogenesis protein [Grosmannia clavigera kw1407]
MGPKIAEKKRKASLVVAETHDESENEGSLDNLINGLTLSQGLLGDEGAEDEENEEASTDQPNYRVTTDANGGVRYVYDEIDPVYDSDDSAQEGANTIGNIPLSFYDSYPHIGYDINGKKIMRPATGEALDALLDSIEVPRDWTGLTDPATGKPLKLSRDELELLRRVQMNELPEDGYDPYPDTIEYFTGIEETMPLSAAPEPKRRFVPSKHEAVRVAKLVRAIREGRILPYKPAPTGDEADAEADEADEGHRYDLWQDEQPREPHAMHLVAPKLPPPGHSESYNCPAEYVPTRAEREAWEAADPEDREQPFLPARYDALRKVPGYGELVKERFERCLDLYLAPRVRRTKLHIDPDSLLPKLPPAEELKPFPTVCQTIFRGHRGWVRCVAIDPTGCWLASGGSDGTVRLWELLSGRQVWSVRLTGGGGAEGDVDAKTSTDDEREPVSCLAWRPGKNALVLAAAAGEDLFLMVPTVAVDPELEQASRAVVDAGFGHAASRAAKKPEDANKQPTARWTRPHDHSLEAAGVLVQLRVRSPIRTVSWHRRGEHFCTVSPAGGRSAVAIHTLSRHLSQVPFRRQRNIPQAAHFHPSRPLFFIATKQRVRVYDLQKMELVKTVQPGARLISDFDVHPQGNGDHIVVGSYDRRLVWHDLEMSARPFRTMRYHDKAVRAVRFHRGGLPLLADASDDGTLQIYFGRVYADPMEAPTIVPLKKLVRGAHRVVDAVGALDVAWHPKEAWCVSAGADGTCRLWM